MSICPKNKSSKGHRDQRRANWKMTGYWILLLRYERIASTCSL
ncbi:MAG: 50S ribosomal protein L32 [Butyrivibrio sp.]|nr:50S ribosomal protein L32 [Butyrivibrio sp.]